MREGVHMDFRKELKERMLVGEGAMGTLLYSYGIDQCYEELNCTNPDQIESIHRAYLEAVLIFYNRILTEPTLIN